MSELEVATLIIERLVDALGGGRTPPREAVLEGRQWIATHPRPTPPTGERAAA